MKIIRALLIPLVLMAQTAHASPLTAPGCQGLARTLELNECRQKEMEAADATLGKYLAAARVRAGQLDLDGASIDEEQKAWEVYRGKHCGNVYDLWRRGTVRYEMAAVCTLQVTRERTLDVWRAYLTFIDSTPPVLPEPTQ